jgi:hypothetical protein
MPPKQALAAAPAADMAKEPRPTRASSRLVRYGSEDSIDDDSDSRGAGPPKQLDTSRKPAAARPAARPAAARPAAAGPSAAQNNQPSWEEEERAHKRAMHQVEYEIKLAELAALRNRNKATLSTQEPGDEPDDSIGEQFPPAVH